MLDWMLRPCTTQQFIKQHLDQRPLHISRQKHQHYFDGLLTKADIQQLLESQQLQYGTNVDVTSYTDGQRTNLNYNGSANADQPETADASTVMRRFNKESCSVRVLHPQRWVEPVYKLLSMLEVELRSPVGCNAYLTPPSSQGFAPHWDDIDAFVLQVEVRIMLCSSKPLQLHSCCHLTLHELPSVVNTFTPLSQASAMHCTTLMLSHAQSPRMRLL